MYVRPWTIHIHNKSRKRERDAFIESRGCITEEDSTLARPPANTDIRTSLAAISMGGQSETTVAVSNQIFLCVTGWRTSYAKGKPTIKSGCKKWFLAEDIFERDQCLRLHWNVLDDFQTIFLILTDDHNKHGTQQLS